MANVSKEIKLTITLSNIADIQGMDNILEVYQQAIELQNQPGVSHMLFIKEQGIRVHKELKSEIHKILGK